MAFTVRELKKGSSPKTLYGEEAIKYLSQAKPTTRDLTKEPELDILAALHLYPNSSYERLMGLRYRFQNTWDSHVPRLVERRLVSQSPEGSYSLTSKGENYFLSQMGAGRSLIPSIVSKVIGYFRK